MTDTITISRATLEQVLAFVEDVFEGEWNGRHDQEEITEALRTALAASGWQPIDTAPKDGSSIIVCSDSGNVWCDVKWVSRPMAGERWEHLSLGPLRFSPTQWMPLPKVLKGEQE